MLNVLINCQQIISYKTKYLKHLKNNIIMKMNELQ